MCCYPCAFMQSCLISIEQSGPLKDPLSAFVQYRWSVPCNQKKIWVDFSVHFCENTHINIDSVAQCSRAKEIDACHAYLQENVCSHDCLRLFPFGAAFWRSQQTEKQSALKREVLSPCIQSFQASLYHLGQTSSLCVLRMYQHLEATRSSIELWEECSFEDSKVVLSDSVFLCPLQAHFSSNRLMELGGLHWILSLQQVRGRSSSTARRSVTLPWERMCPRVWTFPSWRPDPLCCHTSFSPTGKRGAFRGAFLAAHSPVTRPWVWGTGWFEPWRRTPSKKWLWAGQTSGQWGWWWMWRHCWRSAEGVTWGRCLRQWKSAMERTLCCLWRY